MGLWALVSGAGACVEVGVMETWGGKWFPEWQQEQTLVSTVLEGLAEGPMPFPA